MLNTLTINYLSDSMSYDIYLVDPITKETLHLEQPHHMTGGTYAVGGTTRLHLNITYNYAQHFDRVFGDEGIRTIYGLSGAESISLLRKAIDSLGDSVDPDYWKPTEGNAKASLLQLLAMAQLRPDGVWSGD